MNKNIIYNTVNATNITTIGTILIVEKVTLGTILVGKGTLGTILRAGMSRES